MKQLSNQLKRLFFSVKHRTPPPTLRNLWFFLALTVILQNMIVFNNSEITGNAITALIIWGGTVICMEDIIESLNPKPSFISLIIGSIMIVFTLYRSSLVISSDSIIYFLVPIAGIGLLLVANPFRSLLLYKDSIIILLLLPVFAALQIYSSQYFSNSLSAITARLIFFGLSTLGISPLSVSDITIFVKGGAVRVMHECNGFEMILQTLITAIIFLLAFPLRSRIGRAIILISAPFIGFVINSCRIGLLAIFTSLNSDQGKILFDFFHEQAGSLIFSALAIFCLGYLYLYLLDRELPPQMDTKS